MFFVLQHEKYKKYGKLTEKSPEASNEEENVIKNAKICAIQMGDGKTEYSGWDGMRSLLVFVILLNREYFSSNFSFLLE